jgi:hypothetical protein
MSPWATLVLINTRPYETFMGVATLFLRESYQAINGFSNNYYGWGYSLLLVLKCGELSDSAFAI